MSRSLDLAMSRLPPELAAWYALMLAKVDSAREALNGIARSPVPPVRARLIRSGQFAADARFAGVRADAGYEVRLSAALPAIVHFALHCMMRTPVFMPGLGNAQGERPHRDTAWHIPLCLPRGVSTEKVVAAIVVSSRPKDQNRAWVAALMAELAMAFCTYHELAHIVLGHVAFLRQHSRRLGLLEMAENTVRGRQGIGRLRLVWEYEADMMAANLLLQDMMAPSIEAAFQDAYGMEEEFNVLSRVQVMLSAVLVVFLLVAQATPRNRKTHPDPLVRFVSVSNECAATLVEHHPDLGLDFEVMGEEINDVATHTVTAWSTQGLGTSPASPLRHLLTAHDQIERLEQQRLAWHGEYSSLATVYPFRA